MPHLQDTFASALNALGPFEPNPRLAVAVSGGADSIALAILARDWTRLHGGSTEALVVDHGLRQTSAQEARITCERLTSLNIPAKLLQLSNLEPGPALAERARIARYTILTAACRQAGILHLLIGHHAADQAETLAMRVLRGSQTHGLAAMAPIRETTTVRLLRPLLTIDPAPLRDFLSTTGVEWIEDPSNRDMRAMRSRLRHHLRPSDATHLKQALTAVAILRANEEAETAAELARRVTIRPEGFALLSPGRITPAALSRLIQTIAGAPYPPNRTRINQLAAQPGPATIAGVRILPAGRLGNGLLVIREQAAITPPVAARPNTVWDNRFRLITATPLPPDATIGPLGPEATCFRRLSDLPSVILRTLPAIRFGTCMAAIPHLGFSARNDDATMTTVFSPPRPTAGPCFWPQTANASLADWTSPIYSRYLGG